MKTGNRVWGAVELLLLSTAVIAAYSAGGCGSDSSSSNAGAGGGGGEGPGSGTHATSTHSSTSASTSHTSTSTSTSTTSTSTSTGVGGGGGSGGAGGGAPAPLYDCQAPAGTIPTLTLTELGNTFGQALLVKSAPGDPDTLYVVDRTGSVWVYKNGAMLPDPFLTVSTQTDSEEGLLGLAFHPDYVNNGRVFVHYSKAGNGDNVVQEFARSAANPDVVDSTPGAIVLEHTTAEANHNGGALEFGPDGFLYISMGDGGNQGDPECDAQLHMGGEAAAEPENLLGKITRLDVDQTIGATGFPAAAGNPNGLKAYHIGLRNPYRMSFDVCTGDLFIGDVGQDTYEEVDQITQAEGAVNCGWPYREGTHDYPFNTTTCPPKPAAGLKEPILDYQHQQNRDAVIGGYVYRSSVVPSLRGAYFFGDNGSGEIWYTVGGGAPVATPLTPGGGVLGGFGQDGRGNVYVAALDGHLYRIDSQ